MKKKWKEGTDISGRMTIFVKKAMSLLIICIMFLCFWRCAANYKMLKQDTRVMILYEENKSNYTGSYAYELQKDNDGQQEALNFTFWGGQGTEDITGVGLERMEACHIIAICGNSQNLYPEVPALLGQDETGCLISEGAARKLFGEDQVIGLKVKYQSVVYTIRGVIPQEQSVFLYETSSEEVQGLNHVSIENDAEDYLTEPYQKFQTRYGEGEVFDYNFLSGLLKWMMGIFIIMIVILLEWNTIRSYRRCGGGWKYILCVFGIMAFFVSAFLLCMNFGISSDMFPAVWSDYDAWKEIFDREMRKIFVLFYDGKEPFMFRYWVCFGKGLLWGIGSYISFSIVFQSSMIRNTIGTERREPPGSL